MVEDSISGIFDTVKRCAMISKTAGGIGLAIHDVRATDSYVAGINGKANGIIPMIRVFNATARYVDQGGGKRKGAFALYIEPWHADILGFLELKLNHGAEENRARDLFFGLWIPDIFMQRVKENKNWTLMCPNECPGLPDVYGKEFEELYTSYEQQGKGRATMPAQTLWYKILQSQIETGTPYMLYKDSANRKSNQKNLGTIRCSNLCTEIMQYTSPDEVAVCNLASISLGAFVVRHSNGEIAYDYKQLHEVAKVVARNLNKVIDRNYYPVPEARVSNFKHRPIGLGVQGLADAFLLMRYAYESDEARRLNKNIFETIYHGAVEASVELAMADGPYETFKGSPASEGLFQFDLWNVKPDSGLWDWESLRTKMKQHGMRNSLLVAPMPTASTSQILGNNEAFEPYTSNIYCRRVLSGEFFVVNPHLMKDLVLLGIWNEELKQKLIQHDGSVQAIAEIPNDLKKLYKTVWEISQKTVVDMAVERGPFIDQSQSLNIHMSNPNYTKLSSMHFHGWQNGLKTGVYYLRTMAAARPIQFTVDRPSAGAAQLELPAAGSRRSLETASSSSASAKWTPVSSPPRSLASSASFSQPAGTSNSSSSALSSSASFSAPMSEAAVMSAMAARVRGAAPPVGVGVGQEHQGGGTNEPGAQGEGQGPASCSRDGKDKSGAPCMMCSG